MAAGGKQKTRPSRLDQALEWIVAGLGLAFVICALVILGRGALQTQDPAALEVRETGRRLTPAALILDVEVLNTGDAAAAGVEIEAAAGSGTATATVDYVPGRSRREASLSLPPDTVDPVDLSAAGWITP